MTVTNTGDGCATHFPGTSSVAPIAAGIVALVLEVKWVPAFSITVHLHTTSLSKWIKQINDWFHIICKDPQLSNPKVLVDLRLRNVLTDKYQPIALPWWVHHPLWRGPNCSHSIHFLGSWHEDIFNLLWSCSIITAMSWFKLSSTVKFSFIYTLLTRTKWKKTTA